VSHSTPNTFLNELIVERLHHYSERVGECLMWRGQLNEWGYGYTQILGKRFYVHRLLWIVTNGPVPEGLLVCHDCPDGDKPACIEINHLWLGTPRQNTQDMIAKGRSKMKLTRQFTNEQAREILRLHDDGVSNVELGKRFKADHSIIARMVRRETYKDI
jgi:hypothetical protein